MKKFLIALVIGLVYLALANQWYHVYYLGRQFNTMNLVPNILTGSFPLWGAVLAFYGYRWLSNLNLGTFSAMFLLLTSPAIFQSCSERAQANQQTLLTTDCGQSWQLIKTGETIPKCYSMCQCHYSVRVPDYPMQGDSRFRIMFKGNVLANIDVSYDYSITDAKAFISEAKYLGKMNAGADDASNTSSAYEMAENAVIDKSIKEVSRTLILAEDVVDFSPSDLEDKLLEQVNKLLADRGVVLNYLNFVPQFDEQTRLAIDIATAQKIYASKGLDDWAKAVAIARAGATQITLQVGEESPKTEKED
ncbi:MAG: hypothetical protein ACKOW9_05610 [Candidatus Paceibacterota bacterium]